MYDFWIAQAARDYRAAKTNDEIERSVASRAAKVTAYNKLCWMIDAETHGWNPNDYRPE